MIYAIGDEWLGQKLTKLLLCAAGIVSWTLQYKNTARQKVHIVHARVENCM